MNQTLMEVLSMTRFFGYFFIDEKSNKMPLGHRDHRLSALYLTNVTSPTFTTSFPLVVLISIQ